MVKLFKLNKSRSVVVDIFVDFTDRKVCGWVMRWMVTILEGTPGVDRWDDGRRRLRLQRQTEVWRLPRSILGPRQTDVGGHLYSFKVSKKYRPYKIYDSNKQGSGYSNTVMFRMSAPLSCRVYVHILNFTYKKIKSVIRSFPCKLINWKTDE